MSDRFWVGGTGSWSNTANWSETSGGAGGASVPTALDNVIFDAGSDAGGIFTVTVDGTSASPSLCNDFTAGSLDFAMTVAQSATSFLDIHGSLLLPATNVTWTGVSGSRVTFRATTTGKTVTTNGVTIGGGINSQCNFNGAGGEWTLGSALTTVTTVNLIQGTFRTDNYNVTCGVSFSLGAFSTQLPRAVYLGSSTISMAGSLAATAGVVASNITFDAGTSSFIFSNNNVGFNGGGLTYYNVSFTSVGSGTAMVNGANTFNNLSVTSRTTTGQKTIQFSANQTINGILTLGDANTAIRRVWAASTIFGNPITLTVAAMATLSDVDFLDITIAGTAAPVSGTRLGDSGGNSGITFPASKTVYWNLSAGGNWSATSWATSSGGTPDVNNFPLAQDTAIIENAGLNTSATITLDTLWQLSAIDFSTRSNAVTFATGSQIPILNGDLTLSSAVTPTGTAAYAFVKRNATQTFNSAGVTIPNGISYNGLLGTLFFPVSVTTTGTTTLNSGTIDLNNNTLTCTTFTSSNSNARSITFGTSGKIVVTGNTASTPISMATMTNFTYTGTGLFESTYTLSDTRFFDLGQTAGASETNAISLNITAGTGQVQIISGGRVNSLNFTGFSGTFNNNNPIIHGNLTISSGMTLAVGGNTVTFNKTSSTQTITSNGKTLDFPIIKSGAGTLQLTDNLTMGSTRTFTHTAGALDLNGQTLSAGVWSTTGSTARSITFNGGEIDVAGAWTASGSNFTTSGAGSISMNSASAKTFAGGGFTYSCALNQGGAGALTISGNNTFADMTNTVQPATITFTAGSTTSVQDFNVNGTAGNLITLNSSTAGTQWNLVKV